MSKILENNNISYVIALQNRKFSLPREIISTFLKKNVVGEKIGTELLYK